MSDLRPIGIPVMLDGVERYFLFTLNVIDEIQSHYGMTVIDAMEKLYNPEDESKTVRFFVHTLLNDEAERGKWKDPDCNLKTVSEKEVGWMVNKFNLEEVKAAICGAFKISVPEPDDGAFFAFLQFGKA